MDQISPSQNCGRVELRCSWLLLHRHSGSSDAAFVIIYVFHCRPVFLFSLQRCWPEGLSLERDIGNSRKKVAVVVVSPPRRQINHDPHNTSSKPIKHISLGIHSQQ